MYYIGTLVTRTTYQRPTSVSQALYLQGTGRVRGRGKLDPKPLKGPRERGFRVCQAVKFLAAACRLDQNLGSSLILGPLLILGPHDSMAPLIKRDPKLENCPLSNLAVASEALQPPAHMAPGGGAAWPFEENQGSSMIGVGVSILNPKSWLRLLKSLPRLQDSYID